MACAVALSALSAGALGGPPKQLGSLQARADQLATEYKEATARLQAVDAEIAEQSTELDRLVERENQLQRQLDSRVLGMYRGRRLDFIDVLTNSSSFADFSTRLDLLTRMNLSDATALIELRATKLAATRTSKALLSRQEQASAELRRIQAAKRAAATQLSNSKAAYEAYIAKAGADARQRETRMPSRRSTARSQISAKGSGAWKTGVASHYGSGSYGRRTADGTTIGPDSMIVAHKTLPFGTLVEFEYNGRTCVARVADRGPYTPGRMWDLGPGVIQILDFNGVHTVRWRIVGR